MLNNGHGISSVILNKSYNCVHMLFLILWLMFRGSKFTCFDLLYNLEYLTEYI